MSFSVTEKLIFFLANVTFVNLEMPIPKPLRANVERSSVSLFLRPVAGQIFNIIASHGPKGIRYEDIFRDSDRI